MQKQSHSQIGVLNFNSILLRNFGFSKKAITAGCALTPDVEFYGGIGLINHIDPHNEQQHYVFPVVKGELPYGIEYNFGVGVGLTAGSDPVVVKFNVALEKYIGAIFGPSPSNGWLW